MRLSKLDLRAMTSNEVRHQFSLTGGFRTGLGFSPEPLGHQPYRYTRKSSSPESMSTLQANLQKSSMLEKYKDGKDCFELAVLQQPWC